MAIVYTLCPIDYKAHYYEVVMAFVPRQEKPIRLSLPAWIPGSYMIREFARHIVSLSARQSSEMLHVIKEDKDSWWVLGHAIDREIQVTYRVYAWDLSVRGAHLDEHHGFFNGAALFLHVADTVCQADAIKLHIRACDETTRQWQVATGLDRCFEWSPDARRLPVLGQAGLWYETDSYDALIDHPVEMGQLDFANFQVQGINHYLVVYGGFENPDLARLSQDLSRVCDYQIQLFEPDTRQAPFTEYWFLIHATDRGYGGLEHRNSTALLCNRKDLPYQGMPIVLSKNQTDYRNFLGLCSHEYFHAWHVKRIKPASFIPYDLNRENYTRLLWIFEGFTAYYDDLSLVRSQVISQEDYQDILAKTMSSVLKTPGRFMQSVADSSFDAWTKYYRQDENACNSIVSYYTKGALVALCLDIVIRVKSQGRYSLDDVMRTLWQTLGKTQQGLAEGKLGSVVLNATGVDVSLDIADFAYGTVDLPLQNLLAQVGFELIPEVPEVLCQGGCTYQEYEGGIQLKTITHGSALHTAGLSAGDVLIAADGFQMSQAYWKQLQERQAPGSCTDILSFRRGRLQKHIIQWQATQPYEWKIKALDTPGDGIEKAPWLSLKSS